MLELRELGGRNPRHQRVGRPEQLGAEPALLRSVTSGSARAAWTAWIRIEHQAFGSVDRLDQHRFVGLETERVMDDQLGQSLARGDRT